VRRLEGLPPLVLAAECDQLKERLASVARGEAFLLQGGLRAWEGANEVCRREWDRSIPRDFI